MRQESFEILGRVLAITVFVVVMSVASSYGQGSTEVTGHLGIVGGMGPGSHASLGGSLGIPVTDNLSLHGDLSYIPMGGSRVTMLGATTSASASALNFNATLQHQFRATRSVTPYAGAGLGFLRSSFDTSSNVPGFRFSASGSSTDVYLNLGGGFRYFVNGRWGFKPELMIFAGPNTYVRLAGGIFYRFGE